jgi:hypothetical protein
VRALYIKRYIGRGIALYIALYIKRYTGRGLELTRFSAILPRVPEKTLYQEIDTLSHYVAKLHFVMASCQAGSSRSATPASVCHTQVVTQQCMNALRGPTAHTHASCCSTLPLQHDTEGAVDYNSLAALHDACDIACHCTTKLHIELILISCSTLHKRLQLLHCAMPLTSCQHGP